MKSLTSPAASGEDNKKVKAESGKRKTCASEQNTKLALVFYRERSQVSSTRSVVKTASKRAKAKLA